MGSTWWLLLHGNSVHGTAICITPNRAAQLSADWRLYGPRPEGPAGGAISVPMVGRMVHSTVMGRSSTLCHATTLTPWLAGAQISAKKGTGVDDLLETVLLMAEVEQLAANPGAAARGTVIEAHLDRRQGAVAALLVANGTLRVGDVVQAGATFGKARSPFTPC